MMTIKTGGGGRQWLSGNVTGWQPRLQIRTWAPPESVLKQDIEPLIAPDVLAGALHGWHHHRCMNVCVGECDAQAM